MIKIIICFPRETLKTHWWLSGVHNRTPSWNFRKITNSSATRKLVLRKFNTVMLPLCLIPCSNNVSVNCYDAKLPSVWDEFHCNSTLNRGHLFRLLGHIVVLIFLSIHVPDNYFNIMFLTGLRRSLQFLIKILCHFFFCGCVYYLINFFDLGEWMEEFYVLFNYFASCNLVPNKLKCIILK